jgi:outer membrane protein assembly factor BamB
MPRLLILLACLALAADWPRFRGPNGSGATTDAIATTWSASENIAWKVAVPGKGHSSPIIVGGKVFLQSSSNDGSKRMVMCLSAADGSIVWNKEFAGQPTKVHQKSSLASCTPACDGELLYVPIWDGVAVALHALDMSGTIKWSAQLGKFESQHGAGLSPAVFGGKVYLNFDQDGAAEVVAFDAKTGEKAWSQSRKAFRACYSTPIVRELMNGKAELIVFSTAGVTAYDPKSGAVAWQWEIPWKDGEMALRSVASPLLANGTLVCVTGDGSGSRYSAAVTPGRDGVTVNWEKRSSKLAPYVPCPVVKGDHIYWVTDQGIAECLELKTGQIVWSERAVNKAVSASPLLAGDRLLIIDESGDAVIVKANPSGYEKVGAGSVKEAVFASPSIADGKLFIRGVSSLFCIEKK